MSPLVPFIILNGIFNNAAYSDLALVVGQTRFHVQSFFVIQESGLIESLARAPRANPVEIIIALPDLDHIPVPESTTICSPEEYFSSFLRVLYHLDSIESLPVAAVMAIAVIADFALCERVRAMCDDHLSAQEPLPQYLPFAKRHQMPKLKKETLQMIAENAIIISRSEELPPVELHDISEMIPFLLPDVEARFDFFIKFATKVTQDVNSPDAVLLIPDGEHMKLLSEWCMTCCSSWPNFATAEHISKLSKRIQVADSADLETMTYFGKYQQWAAQELYDLLSKTKEIICGPNFFHNIRYNGQSEYLQLLEIFQSP